MLTRFVPHRTTLVAVAGLLALACGGSQDAPQVDAEAAAAATQPRVRFLSAASQPEWVEVDRDFRAALRAEPGTEIRLGLESPAAQVQGGTVLAFDAVLTRRSKEAADVLELAVLWDGVRRETLSISGAWQTLSIALDGPLDRLALARVSGPQAGSTVFVANPRLIRRGTPFPTVILVTSDTHRADHVSAIDPASPATTPHIDRLAEEGALFENCFSSTNITIPSHVALLTGVHPRDTKIVDNVSRLHETADTLAERFREAGYQTHAALSAFLLSEEVCGLGQGFDRMSAPLRTQRDGAQTLAIAERWLRDAEGAPLFLWLHLFDAHTPYELPEEHLSRVRAGRPDPTRPDAELGLPADRIPKWLAKSGIRDFEFVNALYAGEVVYLDGELGAFLEHPRVRTATVAFTADHGEALGERETFWDHFGLRDSTIHIPLVLRGPGATGGAVSAAPVRQIDVGRTLLDMAGLEDVEFPGRDLRRTLEGAAPSLPRFALGAMGMEASIESEGWLLEMFLQDTPAGSLDFIYPMGRVFLYHLPSDPGCRRDRLLDEFERARRMRSALVEWLDRAEATGMNAVNHDLPPQAIAKIEQLGYSTSSVEKLYRWWTPELRDPNWESDPWRVAFQGEGDLETLRGAVEADVERTRRASPRRATGGR